VNTPNYRIFFLCIIHLISLGGAPETVAQNSRGTDAERKRTIDSVEAVLKLANEDTNKINILNVLALEYQTTANEVAIEYGERALSLGKRLKFKKGIWLAHENIGLALYNLGFYEKSVDHYLKQVALLGPNDQRELAGAYQSLGNSISGRGNYLEALDYYIKAETLYEELSDTSGITGAHHNIGVIYYSRKQYDEALKYYFKVLEIVKGSIYDREAQDTYNNIATVYLELHKYELAVEYFTISVQMYKDHDDEWGSAYSLEGLGEVYFELGKYDKAIEILSRALEITKKFEDNYLMVFCYNVLGASYAMQGSMSTAMAYHQRALSMSKEYDIPECLELVHKRMAATYELMNEYEKSLYHFKLSTAITDSLLNAENSRQVNEMATRYDTEKKEKAIELLSKDNDLNQLAISRQRIINRSLGGGFLMVIVLAFLIYRSYRQKQRANMELARINEDISDKNQKITESINYASRIQKAILPPDGFIKNHLPKSFVLFKPKDIVSGDFYWYAEKEGFGMIAAVDCTGHGVPGAFMSMIGNRLLSEIVNEKNISKPSEVLKQLHAGLLASLHSTHENGRTKDGMDIAFCRLNHETLELQYAGAHNPLYVIRNKELSETRGDKLIIGDQRFGHDYTNHSVQLNKGDSFYIFSDGFADQFGGDKRRKYYYGRFKDLLIEIHQNGMEDQRLHLDKVITDWIGGGEQIDDILVIGVRV